MIQIFGKKKSSETRKAVRFCKERSIEYQFIDITEKEISPGELSHILQSVEAHELVDDQGTFYKKNGYEYLEYDPVEEIIEHPQLMRVPILRNRKRAHVGFDAGVFEKMIDEDA
jgi:arsenate reductase-like glutaredoxin family protein